MNLSPSVLAAALVPPFLLAWYARSWTSRRLSSGLTVVLFMLGALSVFPQVYLTSWFEPDLVNISDPYRAGLSEALLTAALPEEVMRLLVLILAVILARGIDEPLRGMAYGAVLASGFAAVEGLFGALGGEGMLKMAVGRTLSAASHCFNGAIMGSFVAGAWLNPRRRRLNLLLALAAPVLLHTLYDFAILTEVPGAAETPEDEPPPFAALGLMLLFPTVWIVELVWTVALIRRCRSARPSA